MSLQREFVSRVRKELKQLQSLKPHGIEVSVPSDSLQIWEAIVPGPDDSLYKGGWFKVQVYLPYSNIPKKSKLLSIIGLGFRNASQQVLKSLTSRRCDSDNYPLGHPTVRFLSPIYHLNVSSSTGHVCLGFLSQENWLPTRCVQDVLSAVFSLLIKPEPENSADQGLLQAYNHNRAVYDDKARKSAKNAC